MLNHVELLGRLAQEPEIRYTQSGTAVASFDLAVQVPSKNKDAAPDYIPIVCWRERAEFCGRYLSKGRQIVVEGRISTRKWKDEKTGQNRKAVEVVASNIYFADSNLQLRQRIVRSMIRVSERTANMRKPEKFEYRKHMTAAFMDMLELCIEANRARGSRRVELQNKMDTKLDVLRSLVDTAVSPEDRLISPGLHEIWSKELNEIGRMLGGWKKSNE